MSVKNMMSEYVRISKYSRYNKEKKRRETWEEQIERMMKMHEIHLGDKIDLIREDFDFAKKMLLEKRVLGSQRALQFGGEAILNKNVRCYNCSFTYCEYVKAFQYLTFLSLAGVGVGLSVQYDHINKLPDIASRKNGKKVFKVEDSIEGWADAIGVLMSSYFVDDCSFPEYQGYEVEFDLTGIRPKGSKLSYTGGKAPGPDPLARAIKSIEKLIDERLTNSNRLAPIDCADIACFCADCSVAGGIRRSAIIILFSKEDNEMMKAKTGSWFIDNPQRVRSNNSVVLLRNNTTKEEFDEIMKSVKEFGEPGFIFSDHVDFGVNPCFTGDMKLLTDNGYETFESLEGKKVNVVNVNGKVNEGKVWCSGEKEVIELTLTNKKKIRCTPNHVFMLNDGSECEAKDTVGKKLYSGSKNRIIKDDIYTKLGYIQGDGCTGRLKSEDHNGVDINFGEKDDDVLKLFDIEKKINCRTYYVCGYKDILTQIEISSEKLPNRGFPVRFSEFTDEQKMNFIRGCYTANGSVIKNHRVSYKTTCLEFANSLVEFFNCYGVTPNVVTNKKRATVFSNGEYVCKQSYNVEINKISDILWFSENIGFVQMYKNKDLSDLIKIKSPIVRSIKNIGVEKVYDFTEPETHWGVVEGVVVHNCVEAGFYARDEFGNAGFEFCNLSEVNAKLCKTADMFYESCRAASILGTIQASYTDFPYLGEITKRITEREALLGVSITGMMDNVEIVFDPEIQRKGAEIVKQTNQRIANIIGIRPAARTTCVKPSGTASTLLGTSSGIHPNHSRRYLRRIRANKNEPTLQFYEMFNPKAVEEDYTSINKTDKVITFLCEVPKNARTKVDTPALTLLEYVKSTKINWVDAGRVDEYCTTPFAKHNISNTINCRDDEYDDVANFIFDNREYFTGISLLPQSGDLDYIQAPFTVIKTPDEIIKTYGSGSLLASGVIVNACRVFNDNLWAACDCVLGIGERLDDLNISGMSHEVASVYINQQLNKKQWVERAKKFAINYFDGDLRKMTYCLKDVNNYKTWVDIERTHVDVPWEMLTEEVDNTKVEQSVACAGGQCEV